jgi:hypothetical protein
VPLGVLEGVSVLEGVWEGLAVTVCVPEPVSVIV